MYLGPYESGNAGTARHIADRLGRMPHGLDVVLMQVVDECRVIPLGVLRPDPGLAADGRAVCDGGREECIHGVPTLGGERNMRRCGHGLPTADREVVQFLGPVGDAVVLNVKFLIAEWGEGGCIEPPARVQVCHNEEHVIDDDAANRHWLTLSTPGLGSLLSEATRLLDGCAGPGRKGASSGVTPRRDGRAFGIVARDCWSAPEGKDRRDHAQPECAPPLHRRMGPKRRGQERNSILRTEGPAEPRETWSNHHRGVGYRLQAGMPWANPFRRMTEEVLALTTPRECFVPAGSRGDRRRAWLPAVADSVGEPCRFHDLRHSHAALLIAQDVHPKVLQERLGHASIRTTLDVYGHLLKGLDEAAAESLDAVFSQAAAGRMRDRLGTEIVHWRPRRRNLASDLPLSWWALEDLNL